MDLRHAAEGLCCMPGACRAGAGGRGGRLSVDSRAAGCCCDSCESEGGSNGLVSGSEPSAAAFLLRKKELPALRKELPNLVRLGLAAMMWLTVGD